MAEVVRVVDDAWSGARELVLERSDLVPECMGLGLDLKDRTLEVADLALALSDGELEGMLLLDHAEHLFVKGRRPQDLRHGTPPQVTSVSVAVTRTTRARRSVWLL